MRNPEDAAIAQTFPDAMNAIAQSYGAADAAGLNDAEFHAAVNEVLRSNLPALYGRALKEDGLTLDVSVAPSIAQRFADAGIGMKQVQEAGDFFYDGPRSEGVRKLQKELEDYEKHKAKPPLGPDGTPMFDDPVAESSFGRRR